MRRPRPSALLCILCGVAAVVAVLVAARQGKEQSAEARRAEIEYSVLKDENDRLLAWGTMIESSGLGWPFEPFLKVVYFFGPASEKMAELRATQGRFKARFGRPAEYLAPAER